MTAIKARQKATWESGDFGQVAKYIEPVAEEFMSRLEIAPGARVLDVACGNGNLAVIAARRGARVKGVDIAQNLIEQARARSAKLELPIQFREGDAEALPYSDGEFDLVVSMYGVMFTPRPEISAAELLRVTRPGGVIAMANWTPEGFIGKMFEIFKRFVTPPPGVPSPLQWGSENTVRERLQGVSQLKMTRHMATMDIPFSPEGTVEFFRKYYGPTQRSFAALPEPKQAELRKELEALQKKYNESKDPARTITKSEYLEIVAVK